MNTICKFKLYGRGNEAIEVEGEKYSQLKEGSPVVVDSITLRREGAISRPLLNKINKLKYFYLNLTGHWISQFNNYYDMDDHMVNDPPTDGSEMKYGHQLLKDLFLRTFITAVSVRSDGFVITGMIETVQNKFCTINTPFISEADDLGFFLDAKDMIRDIFEEIRVSINQLSIMDVERARRYLLEMNKEKDKIAKEMTEMTDDQIVDRAMDIIHEKGGVILVPDEGQQKEIAEETQGDHELNTNTANIDAGNLAEVNEETKIQEDNSDIEQQTYEQEKLEEIKNEEQVDQETPWGTDEQPVDAVDEENVLKAPDHITKKPADSTLASESDFPNMEEIPAGGDTKEW